jgi:hypothetical protein
MHIRSWIFVTVSTLFLTGFVLSRAGWLSDQTASPSARRALPSHVHATSHDLFASEAGCRFRSCEPRHWKYWVLKH